MGEGRFFDDFVDAGGENEAEILRKLAIDRSIGCVDFRTSGYPLGSMKASGTTPLSFFCRLSLGGEGFAVYSVRAKLVKLGVLGLLSPLVWPLVVEPFCIVSVCTIAARLQQCNIELVRVVFVVVEDSPKLEIVAGPRDVGARYDQPVDRGDNPELHAG